MIFLVFAGNFTFFDQKINTSRGKSKHIILILQVKVQEKLLLSGRTFRKVPNSKGRFPHESRLLCSFSVVKPKTGLQSKEPCEGDTG